MEILLRGEKSDQHYLRFCFYRMCSKIDAVGSEKKRTTERTISQAHIYLCARAGDTHTHTHGSVKGLSLTNHIVTCYPGNASNNLWILDFMVDLLDTS
jgi:hypothetical protein